jgi:hypothetical protein
MINPTKSNLYIPVFAFFALVFFSCSKNDGPLTEDVPGFITIAFDLTKDNKGGRLENLNMTDTLVATIEDNGGQVIYDRVVFPSSAFNPFS